LDGHTDGVYCSALSKRSLVQFLTGACDGEVRVWDMNVRKCVWRAYAHSGFVRGLSVAPDGDTFFSCGDKTVKQWKLCVAGDTREVRVYICV
jgi:WD repeat and SOF domain-containing protein 1